MRKFLFACLLFISFNVYALDRIALVIGNADYHGEYRLKKSTNDAKDIAASLEELGFDEVKLVLNKNKTDMEKAIREFSLLMQESDTSLFFYFGHAVQMGSKNYLLPINSLKAIKKNLGSISNFDQIQRFENEAISLDLLISLIENGNSEQNFIFLDACRSNPLPKNTLEGLSKMTIGEKGTLIAYSTSPGKLALDGNFLERNSPYTKQLLKFIKTPNQPIEIMLKEVGSAVSNETDGKQLPWVATNLTSNFCFNDVDGGCAKVLIPIPGIPFLDGLYNIKVKDLDNGNHYIGQIKNGMFNGKGVLTYKNGATYEGDFVDDKKDGYGTLTQSNGNNYKGHFLNDEKHGTGTLIYINGATIETEWDMGIRIFSPRYFTGELDDRGKYHGAGILVTSIGQKFKGVWNHGTLEGDVEVTYSGGGFYIGKWKNGNRNGKGIKRDTDGQIYEGNFINGKLNGHGIKTWFNGDRYVGEFFDSNLYGYGILTYAYNGFSKGEWKNGFLNGKGHKVKVNGDRYDGDFLKGQYHGNGTYTWTDSASYEGQWKNGQKHGRGKYTWTDDASYEGQWKDNQKHGRGKYIWSNGKIYEGEYLNNYKHGEGIFTWPNGSNYAGEFLNGNRNGKGIFTLTDGTRYEVVYKNDELKSNKAISIKKE